MNLTFADPTEDTIDLHVVAAPDLDAWLTSADAPTRTWLKPVGLPPPRARLF